MKCAGCGKKIKAGDRIFYYDITDEETVNNSTGCVCIDVITVYHRECLVLFLKGFTDTERT